MCMNMSGNLVCWRHMSSVYVIWDGISSFCLLDTCDVMGVYVCNTQFTSASFGSLDCFLCQECRDGWGGCVCVLHACCLVGLWLSWRSSVMRDKMVGVGGVTSNDFSYARKRSSMSS